MKLLLTDDPSIEATFDTVVMGSAEFNSIKSQPFIASSRFETVVVDLACPVNVIYLRELARVSKVIPKLTTDKVTSHAITLLSDLYKESAAKLRYTFMREPGKVTELVNEMATIYGWAESY